MIVFSLALTLGEALGLATFGVGIILISLGITIIIVQEILRSLLRWLQARIKETGKGEPWDFMQKLLEEMFSIIKDLPVPLRVAFLLIIFGTILLAMGYSMVAGIWPPI